MGLEGQLQRGGGRQEERKQENLSSDESGEELLAKTPRVQLARVYTYV